MYGVIGRIKAISGQRDLLSAVLVRGTQGMPGCLSYIVAYDPNDEDSIWVTEIWESPECHRASLSLPSVRQALARGKAFIASFGERFETRPVGGHGI